MLRLLGWIIKTLLFSLVVIVVSNTVHWRGRTISDQVKLQLAHAERMPIVEKIPGEIRDWVGTKKSGHHSDARDTLAPPAAAAVAAAPALRARQSTPLHPREALASEDTAAQAGRQESLPASERQKLKALIRELNGPQGRD